MAERKLNLNAPLLSVRRIPSKLVSADGDAKTVQKSQPNRQHTTLSFHKADLNLDQVTEPVAVPFQWEQVPGQAKDGSEPIAQHLEEASSTLRLHQTRILDDIKQPMLKNSGELYGARLLTEVSSSNDDESKLYCSMEGANENGGSDSENDEDFYSDALDTLSPTDSFSLNCSVTGLSGSDALALQPSGTFSSDPHVRDFMMSRFLPAAKAMAVEPPKYASRKQLVAMEQPRQIMKVVSGNKTPSVSHYESIVIQHQEQNEEEDESEDEDEEYENLGNISSKARGFFPRLCFRNSLCLLNPVPGMKVKTQSGKQGKATSIGSHWQTVKKRASDAVCKHNSEARSREIQKSDSKLNSGSNRFAYSNDQKTASRSSSPFRRSGSGFVSPFRNIPRSLERKPGARSCELPKLENKLNSGSDRVAYPNDQQTTNRSSPFRRSGSAFVSPHRHIPRLPEQNPGTRSCELPRIENMFRGGSNNFVHSYDQTTNRSSPNRRSGSSFVSPHRNIPRFVEHNSGPQSCELPKTDNKLNNGSDRFIYSNDQQTTNRSSPLRHSGSGFVSPYRGVPQSPFHGKEFQGIPKEAKKFTASMLSLNNKRSSKSQEFILPQRTKQELRSISPVVEKTLYVDSVNISEFSCSNSSCLDTKRQMDLLGDELVTSFGSRGAEHTGNAESTFHPKSVTKAETKISCATDAYQSSLSDTSHLKGQANKAEGFQLDRQFDREFMALALVKVNTDVKQVSSTNQLSKVDDLEYFDTGLEQPTLPPPLPKTPSESWLGRTLPSISSRNPFSQLSFGTRLQSQKEDLKTSSADTKWETIVKSSYLHHDHGRYSEELIRHISQQSKS